MTKRLIGPTAIKSEYTEAESREIRRKYDRHFKSLTVEEQWDQCRILFKFAFALSLGSPDPVADAIQGEEETLAPRPANFSKLDKGAIVVNYELLDGGES